MASALIQFYKLTSFHHQEETGGRLAEEMLQLRVLHLFLSFGNIQTCDDDKNEKIYGRKRNMYGDNVNQSNVHKHMQ